ncbi:hypothetical protein [Flavobacterium sp.]|uniref:hypothetical protein n=1 Tax=Flavobacterium sp. TaxID=239 RepID=UPI0031DD66A8
MKKTALTFGLFSLVAVATSFANPNIVSNAESRIVPPFDIDGGATGGQKKADFHASNGNKQLGFSSVNQSIGTDKKVD